MTTTAQFIERKKVQSPHSRTLRMLEACLPFIQTCADDDDAEAEIILDLLDRIASEPRIEAKLNP
jgi:hypothetical protein